ncbi:MAG: hypothetical protein GXO55_11320 [Chloroflexi bacterium]|nr:hypothetical protein [Chloroflexota bacterium]
MMSLITRLPIAGTFLVLILSLFPGNLLLSERVVDDTTLGLERQYMPVIAQNAPVGAPTRTLPLPLGTGAPPPGNGQYAIIAWNDLGMHCMDADFEDFALLPPYNTLMAQVVRRGDEPKIVTDVQVEYRILANTTSAQKVNFWDYAQKLFNLNAPLPPDIGLKGFGLQGRMRAEEDHFIAEGIPVTEFRDDYPRTPYPYQIAEVVARSPDGDILASTQTVVPVSSEMHCESCHQDNGVANPDIATGKVKQNILLLHDREEETQLFEQRPVLCASCHASHALGTSGRPGVDNLSRVMHGTHREISAGPDGNVCYRCHPGPQTRCLRGAMAQAGHTCQDCHGTLADMARPGRRPWIDEPRCSQCHASEYSENPGRLYRFSKGHKGIYCQACHGSQHAIYPSREYNDNIQSFLLQGKAGTIRDCLVCHTNPPDADEGPHRGDDHDSDDGDD